MLTARDMMNEKLSFCSLDTPIKSLSQRFVDESITGILVVDDSQCFLGILTENDLIDQQAKLHMPTAIAIFDMIIPLGEAKFEQELGRMQAMVAEDLMTFDVQTIDVNANLSQVATLMTEKDIHHLPVLDNNVVVGLLTPHDLMKALSGQLFAS
ncbi:MAG: CBS domain-containing protein [Mariprofundaceae bacterium]|nr:CBS domain-containing protein [Mariprofundaceae bacterium]